MSLENLQTPPSSLSNSSEQIPLSKQVSLVIRQQPKFTKSTGVNEKDRKTIDPLPILQLFVDDPASSGQTKNFVSNPFYFTYATLIHATTDQEYNIMKDTNSRTLAGSIVSSLQRLKDLDDTFCGFFVFPDISVRIEGKFRIRFTLFEIVDNDVINRCSVISDIFTVHGVKGYPGASESTELSRHLAEQGLKIRVKKDTRQSKNKSNSRTRDSEPIESESPRKRHTREPEIKENGKSLISKRPSRVQEEPPIASNQFLSNPNYGSVGFRPPSNPYYPQQPFMPFSQSPQLRSDYFDPQQQNYMNQAYPQSPAVPQQFGGPYVPGPQYQFSPYKLSHPQSNSQGYQYPPANQFSSPPEMYGGMHKSGHQAEYFRTGGPMEFREPSNEGYLRGGSNMGMPNNSFDPTSARSVHSGNYLPSPANLNVTRPYIQPSPLFRPSMQEFETSQRLPTRYPANANFPPPPMQMTPQNNNHETGVFNSPSFHGGGNPGFNIPTTVNYPSSLNISPYEKSSPSFYEQSNPPGSNDQNF
ncbi:hypothetical protein HK098_005878 [Nowakowskiella sp. JEL0407]|nr:hypothetical protein HK098_005878 [Nowakowskiella sp. JEL0407]